MKNFLALDLGAESGRAILGALADGKLTLEELHRFPNQPVFLPTGMYWDTFRLWHEIQRGMAVAGRERKLSVDGVGVDTWGVDFGLLGEDGALVDNPRHYRDSRNNGMTEKIFETVPKADVFAETGIQFMDLNSLCQLYAVRLANSPALQVARTLLFMPDLFNYWLSGVQKVELTIASTSQFYNPVARGWATNLLGKLGIPHDILPEIVPSGAKLGTLLPQVAETTGLSTETPVFTTGCHDTASAVAAVPAETEDWCYISSGTWSLMGAELDEPIVTEQCMAENLTNEIGAEGKVRLLRNIAGLWVLQECRRAWMRAGQEYSYADLASMAGVAKPFTAIIKPDEFFDPGRMPERIAEYCAKSGQSIPEQPGEMARTILESLALRYRQVLESLELLLGRKLTVIHILGGGSKNQVLNQFVADATGKTVVAGPVEATAAGNVLLQAMGAGEVSGLGELRRIVRASFPCSVFEPGPKEGWDAAYDKFVSL